MREGGERKGGKEGERERGRVGEFRVIVILNPGKFCKGPEFLPTFT